MVAPVVTAYSEVFPTSVQDAFDRVLPAPLPDLFARRFGPIPPIKAVEGQVGVWGQVGQTRTIRLADGGTMQEELTRVDRPAAFGYTISSVTGPMKPLVAGVDGLWSFTASGSGTEITWQWTITPRSQATALLMPVFCRMWRAYAARSFVAIGRLVAD